MPSHEQEVEIAHRYFSSFAQDYHRAFEGKGRSPLHALINMLYRQRTFQERTDIVKGLLETHGIAGKQVLDLGCGSGEVSLIAAQLGALVTGLDIVEEMVTIAQQEADALGLSDRTTFRVADIVGEPVPQADVTMMIGVIEYYGDIATLLPKVCAVTAELLIIVDTRGPWWRRTLRHFLARIKRFNLYYHSPEKVASIVTGAGFSEQVRLPGHSYTVMAFIRTGATA